MTMTIREIRKEIQDFNNRDSVSRNEIQSFCIKFRDIDCNVALFWAPRVGKTNATLNILNGESVLVCSNTQLIRDNWVESLSTYTGKWNSICYASLKNQNPIYDTIVCDEADLISENYADLIRNLNPKKVIFLTGTATMRLGALLDSITSVTKKDTVKWYVDIPKAIQWGILPKPKIVCVKLGLRNGKRDQLYPVSKAKDKTNTVIPYMDYLSLNNYDRFTRSKKENFHVQCSEQEYSKMIDNDIEYWKSINKDPNSKVPNIIAVNKMKLLGSQRKEFYAQKKLRYLDRLIKYFQLEGKRLLIFANSINQAESVDFENDGYNVIVSTNKNKDALDRFNGLDSFRLIAVGMLDRGIEIRNIDASIIIQVSATDASITQKASRNLLDNNPLLILPFFGGTKDEEWVSKFVTKFPSEFVKVVDVSKYCV